MPRQARLDEPGTLHHVVIRGIDRKKIVTNDQGRQDFVLKWFRSKEGEAKRAYRRFVKKGVDQGRRPDLVGGGLIRFPGRLVSGQGTAAPPWCVPEVG